jgi:hypothetical protein
VKKLLALAGLLALGGSLGVVLASCGSSTASSPGCQREQMHTNSTSVLNFDRSSPARLAGDGRYFGYVRAVDGKSQPPTISFDVAQFFFGKAVQAAAEEDGAVAPGEPVSNDHYERNPDTRAQTLALAKNAHVGAAKPVTRLTVAPDAGARCRSGCTDGIPVSLADFFASFEQEPTPGRGSAAGIPVWVTIREGLVVRIDEQYFP